MGLSNLLAGSRHNQRHTSLRNEFIFHLPGTLASTRPPQDIDLYLQSCTTVPVRCTAYKVFTPGRFSG